MFVFTSEVMSARLLLCVGVASDVFESVPMADGEVSSGY